MRPALKSAAQIPVAIMANSAAALVRRVAPIAMARQSVQIPPVAAGNTSLQLSSPRKPMSRQLPLHGAAM